MKFNPFEKRPQENKVQTSPFKLESPYGNTIKEIFEEMIKISKQKNVDVVSDFYDEELKVSKDSNLTAEDLYCNWLEKENERKVNYHNSDEYKKDQEKEKEDIAQTQLEMDKLEKELPNLDFSNQGFLLDWLCKYEKNKWKGVNSDVNNDILIFNKNGYKIVTSSLDQKYLNDKDKSARFTIGQALYQMYTHGSPHSLINKNTQIWKDKFEVKN